MNPGDVSFTFLHRIEEVEMNVRDRRWQSALALTLTLPDICGGIAFPDMVKKYRDGRAMLDRHKNPTRDVGGQYIRWFDQYASDFFKLSPEDTSAYICGERCWQLRCEYLHQNKGFINDDEKTVRFHLGVNCGTSVCQAEHAAAGTDAADIRIDIEQFCLRMCRAARNYYEAAHTEKDFSLYNTPVLDFIQASRQFPSASVIVLLCGNEPYAKGLMQVLRTFSDQVLIFSSPGIARKKLEKRGPDLWIITDDLTRQPDQPWRSDKTTPVFLLPLDPTQTEKIAKNPGKLTVLSIPVRLNAFREAIKKYL